MSTALAGEILLVEDNPDDAALTLRALARQHLADHVHLVRDGAEAVAYLRDNPPPKVVLLDLKLPKLSGLEVLQHIRTAPRTRALPVVMLTSSREEPDIAAAYTLGVNSYIVKPVEFDAFIRSVSEAGMYWLLLNQPPSRTQ